MLLLKNGSKVHSRPIDITALCKLSAYVSMLSFLSVSHGISEALKVSKSAKIRNRYNQVPHQTQDTHGKMTNLQ